HSAFSVSLLLLSNGHAAKNAFSDLENTIQLSREIGLAGELDHRVHTLGLIVDGIGETLLAPIINRIDRTVRRDQVLELVDQSGGSLLVEVGGGNHHGFVLSHILCTSFWTYGPLPTQRARINCAVWHSNLL